MVPARSRAWLVVLFVVVLALPTLGVSAYLTYGVQNDIAGAQSERAGLGQLGTLSIFMRDASAYARDVSCGKTPSPAQRARAQADASAVDAALSPPPAAWTQTMTAWRGLPAIPSTSDFGAVFDPLVATFVAVSDRSGLTFDPDTPGIDLSDALAYRLPEASAQLGAADRALCSIAGSPSLERRLVLRKAQVLADKSASDAFQDISDAIDLEGTQLDMRELDAARAAAQRAAPAASSALEALMLSTAPQPPASRAARTLGDAIAAVEGLKSAVVPVFQELLDRRLGDYGRRRLLCLLPGFIGILAAILVAFLALRLVSEHAALEVAERAAAEQERMALHDSLTGVMNRRAFYAALQRAVSGGPHLGALCIFDIDDFKGVNDTFGHFAGDEVLTRLAQTIEASVRSTDAVARIGGDEFAVFMHPPVDRRGIERVLAKITADMATPITLKDQTFTASVSVGAALIAGDTMDEINSALAHADAALYRAKASGRGSYAFSDAR